MRAGAPNPSLLVVPPAAPDVPRPRLLDRDRARAEAIGPGPDFRGLCRWASLLHNGVPSGRAAPAAEGELEGARAVRHVFRCDLSAGEAGEEEEGLLGRGRRRREEELSFFFSK